MNIRQIEEQLGIPRANVRYYEKEGLLHPQRGENNYRNYSEEDVETLKKIKLLRQLDMPVDTIRAVQQGDMTLEDALSFQSRILRSEAARLECSNFSSIQFGELYASDGLSKGNFHFTARLEKAS